MFRAFVLMRGDGRTFVFDAKSWLNEIQYDSFFSTSDRLFQNPTNFTNYWIRRTTVCLGMRRSISWALHKISLALSYHRCSQSAATFTPEVVSKYQAHCGARGQLPNYRGVRPWSSMPSFWSATCGSDKCTGACKK